MPFPCILDILELAIPDHARQFIGAGCAEGKYSISTAPLDWGYAGAPAAKTCTAFLRECGAGCRTRTCYLMITNQLLYQMS